MKTLSHQEEQIIKFIRSRVPETVKINTQVSELLSEEFDALDFFTLIRDIEKKYDVEISTEALGIYGDGTMGEMTIRDIIEEIRIQNLDDGEVIERIRDAIDEILSEAQELHKAGDIMQLQGLSERSRKILAHARRADELAKRSN